MPISPTKKKLLIIGFALTFLYALQLSIPLYTLARFLSIYFDNNQIVYVYLITAVIGMYIINLYNKFLSRYHNFGTASTIILVNIISLLIMAFVNNGIIIGFYSVVYMTMNSLLAVSTNLYIQEFSEHHDVGMVRGINLILTATALICGLYISKVLLLLNISIPHVHTIYGILYIATAILLIPMLLLINHYFKNIEEPRYRGGHMWRVLSQLHRNKDLYGVFIANLALQVFITIMIVYFVNYLIDYGNVLLSDYVGVLMPVALLPFILLPYAIGSLSDRKYGEKEFMIWGLVIMSVTVFCIPIITHYNNISMVELNNFIKSINEPLINFDSNTVPVSFKNLISNNGNQSLIVNMQDVVYRKILLAWAMLLVVGRIGSSVLETASTSYFYKKISKKDSDIISLFNNSSSLAMAIAGVLAMIAIYINRQMGVNYAIFILAGAFCLCSIYYVSRVEDTL